MALSQNRVAQTARFIEDAIRSLDQVLGWEFLGFRWDCRDIFKSPRVTGQRIESAVAAYLEEKVFVTVKGRIETADGRVVKIRATIQLMEIFHSSRDDDGFDASEPLEVNEIILASNGESEEKSLKYSFNKQEQRWFRLK